MINPNTDNVLSRAGNSVSEERYEISEHVVRSITGGRIKTQEVEDAILKGKIIEIHSNPKRGKSFLALGRSHGKAIDVIFAEPKDGLLAIVMSYYPSSPIWKDPETRLPRGNIAVNDTQGNCFFCAEKINNITVGNFDHRLEGQLYVIKNVPAGLCVGCGEKYVSARATKRIGELVEQGKAVDKEEVLVFDFG